MKHGISLAIFRVLRGLLVCLLGFCWVGSAVAQGNPANAPKVPVCTAPEVPVYKVKGLNADSPCALDVYVGAFPTPEAAGQSCEASGLKTHSSTDPDCSALAWVEGGYWSASNKGHWAQSVDVPAGCSTGDNASIAIVSGFCSEVPQCTAYPAGETLTESAALGSENPNDRCVSSCLFNYSASLYSDAIQQSQGQPAVLSVYTSTGQYCSGSDTFDAIPTEDLPTGDEGVCQSNESGDELCVSTEDPDCGLVNGDPFCVSDIPDNSCTINEDGSGFCVGEYGAPPAPEDPDQPGSGEPAPPDQQITNNTNNSSTTINYYGDGMQTGTDADGGDGDCTPTETEDCSGTGSGGDCDPASEDCDDTGGDKGQVSIDGKTAGSFGAAIEQFNNRVQASALGNALDSIGSGVPGGSCPEFSMSVLNTTVSTETHCEVGYYLLQLASLFVAAWSLIAVRIFFS